jgi:hypothetical protein
MEEDTILLDKTKIAERRRSPVIPSISPLGRISHRSSLEEVAGKHWAVSLNSLHSGYVLFNCRDSVSKLFCLSRSGV